jgi:hypothetical protein
MYAPTPLRKGQRVRLEPDGPVVEIYRVTSCAAYPRSLEIKHVKLADGTEFDAKSTKTQPISRNAFVYPEDPE